MRTTVFIICIGLIGCSYTWIRGDGAGPVDQVTVGTFLDLTSHGGLAVQAQNHVYTTVVARKKPQLLEGAPYRLEGTIRSESHTPIGFDHRGRVVAGQVVVSVRIHVRSKEGVIWQSSPARAIRGYVRGGSALETSQARRQALRGAMVKALDQAMMLYFREPSLTGGRAT